MSEVFVIVVIVYTVFAFIAGVKIAQLEYHHKEAERLFDVALRDVYDCRFQLLNLIGIIGNSNPGYVYVVESDTGHFKIGRTVNPNDRAKTFGVKLPVEIKFLVLIETGDHVLLESVFHKQYKHKRGNGEWFDLTPTDLMFLSNFPGNVLKAAA